MQIKQPTPEITSLTFRRYLYLALVVCAALLVTSCSLFESREEEKITLTPASFKDLPGWYEDDLGAVIPALQRSCSRMMKGDSGKPFGKLDEAGRLADWQQVCAGVGTGDGQDAEAVRRFLELHFQPFQVTAANSSEGLFTGYYEASLKGSRRQHGPYQYPLHARPDDLVMVNLGEFREDLGGQRIAGRVENGRLKPYEQRSEIIAGNWPHDDQVLVWVDDAVDAFFVQIQGSGVVDLADGSQMRIGYAGQNGHIYTAIGRELIRRGELTREEVSMQSIREWLASHPGQADELMNTNKSYVFFHELVGRDGPLGGEGVELTPGRSLAIDHSLIPYGVPVWVDIEAAAPDGGDLRRLMMAQDTGGAIRGGVRGDVFWGNGDRAASLAGKMNAQGRYWLLLPK